MLYSESGRHDYASTYTVAGKCIRFGGLAIGNCAAKLVLYYDLIHAAINHNQRKLLSALLEASLLKSTYLLN